MGACDHRSSLLVLRLVTTAFAVATSLLYLITTAVAVVISHIPATSLLSPLITTAVAVVIGHLLRACFDCSSG
jgi:hypothetical protein